MKRQVNIALTAIATTSSIGLFANQNSHPSSAKQATPNVILIVADDLGYGDLSCYGHPTISTPNLDTLASEGVRFTQFYVGSSISTPSRGGIMTGRLAPRTGLYGVKRGVLFPNSALGIPAQEVTLAEMMKSSGYTTACIGKWHLGHRDGFLPTDNGFDYYYGIPYSNDMGARTPLMENKTVIESNVDQRNITKNYTKKAIEFIKKSDKSPFLLYFPHTFPHTPLFASDQYLDSSKRGLYGDVVSELDWSIGEVLKTLKECGIDDNTIVIFISDNGPWTHMKSNGGSAGLLRDGKFSVYDGGFRVPAIIRFPNLFNPRIERELAASVDILPTVAELCKCKLPDVVLDGVSLLPLLRDSVPVRDKVYFYDGAKLKALRIGKIKAHFDKPQLYNIDVDPSERYNLYETMPHVWNHIKAEAAKFSESFELAPPICDSITTQ